MRYHFSIRRAIPGYEGLYSATMDGRIYSERGRKYLRPANDNHGYQRVVLCKDGKPKNYRVHRLVAMTWISNLENLPQINHKNEIKTDNRVSNLDWISAKDNNNYGSHNERSAISRGKPVYCVELDKTFYSINAVAKELCISVGSLCRTLNAHNGKCVYNGLHFKYVEKKGV